MHTEKEAKKKKTGCKHEYCLASECVMWIMWKKYKSDDRGNNSGHCGLTK